MTQVLLLLLLAAAIWFWMDTLRTKEIATRLCIHACRTRQVQFLDGTVCLVRLGIKRDANGRLRIRRWYRFDFSLEGIGRRRGNLLLLGLDLEALDLDVPPIVQGPIV